jgi:hypothetical protein
MVNLGVMRKVIRSKWAFPAFTVPKKDTTLRVGPSSADSTNNVIHHKLDGDNWVPSYPIWAPPRCAIYYFLHSGMVAHT